MNLVRVIDPDTVVLGGGIVADGVYAREDSGETSSYDHAFCQQRGCHYETESRIYRASGGRRGGDEYVIRN